MSKWTETKVDPPRYERILIYSWNGIEVAIVNDEGFFMVDALHDMSEPRSGVTHWMKFPKPPRA